MLETWSKKAVTVTEVEEMKMILTLLVMMLAVVTNL